MTKLFHCEPLSERNRGANRTASLLIIIASMQRSLVAIVRRSQLRDAAGGTSPHIFKHQQTLYVPQLQRRQT